MKYPKYYFYNDKGEPKPFIDVFCVKRTGHNRFVLVKSITNGVFAEPEMKTTAYPYYKDCIKSKSWIEVKPEEVVLKYGVLP